MISLSSLLEMDPYKKLSEVGACLFMAGKHELCIRVLNTTSKVATKQKGITMKVATTCLLQRTWVILVDYQ